MLHCVSPQKLCGQSGTAFDLHQRKVCDLCPKPFRVLAKTISRCVQFQEFVPELPEGVHKLQEDGRTQLQRVIC